MRIVEATQAIGSAIKAARVAAGLSRQADLADLVGVDASMVSRWEAGRSRPADEMVMAVEDALGLQRGRILVDPGLVAMEGLTVVTGPAGYDQLSPESRAAVDAVALRLALAERHAQP